MQKTHPRRPGTVPVLTPEGLDALSVAALKSRFAALQRMPGRMPDHIRAEARTGQPIAGICAKTQPLWREAYSAVRDALRQRAASSRERSDA